MNVGSDRFSSSSTLVLKANVEASSACLALSQLVGVMMDKSDRSAIFCPKIGNRHLKKIKIKKISPKT